MKSPQLHQVPTSTESTSSAHFATLSSSVLSLDLPNAESASAIRPKSSSGPGASWCTEPLDGLQPCTCSTTSSAPAEKAPLGPPLVWSVEQVVQGFLPASHLPNPMLVSVGSWECEHQEKP